MGLQSPSTILRMHFATVPSIGLHSICYCVNIVPTTSDVVCNFRWIFEMSEYGAEMSVALWYELKIGNVNRMSKK